MYHNFRRILPVPCFGGCNTFSLETSGSLRHPLLQLHSLFRRLRIHDLDPWNVLAAADVEFMM
jgi:hypothetical protein